MQSALSCDEAVMKPCAVCVEPFVDGVLEEDRVDTTAMLMREEHEGCQPMQVHARWSECDKLPPVYGRKRVQRERCCVQVMIAGVLFGLWSRVECGSVSDGQHEEDDDVL